MAIGAGLTSAILNPLHEEEINGIMGADVLMGHDGDCRKWLTKFREPAVVGTRGDRGERRRRRNRA